MNKILFGWIKKQPPVPHVHLRNKVDEQRQKVDAQKVEAEMTLQRAREASSALAKIRRENNFIRDFKEALGGNR